MLAANDHREIGRRLDLFHFQEEAAGMVFWHPRGYRTLSALEALIRRHADADGFAEVRTPQLLRQPIWEASGHWQHFRENMFVMADDALAVKPVSCPDIWKSCVDARRRIATCRSGTRSWAWCIATSRAAPCTACFGSASSR